MDSSGVRLIEVLKKIFVIEIVSLMSSSEFHILFVESRFRGVSAEILVVNSDVSPGLREHFWVFVFVNEILLVVRDDEVSVSVENGTRVFCPCSNLVVDFMRNACRDIDDLMFSLITGV